MDYEKLYKDLYAEHMELKRSIKERAYTWIPCSERKPTTEEGIIICYEIEDERYVSSAIYIVHNDCEYWFGDNGLLEDRKKVIAWMPLPEPYMEEA